MSALDQLGATAKQPGKRRAAGRIADATLRGGLIGAVVGALAWLIGSFVFGTAMIVLIVATVVVAVYTVMRGDKTRYGVWAGIAIAWAVVLLEHWAVSGHGGFIVGMATWLGVVLGARRGGIAKWALPLLAFPVAFGVIVLLAGQHLLHPWGVSWLWVAAVLGPVAGVRTLLNPSPKTPATPQKPDPLAGL